MANLDENKIRRLVKFERFGLIATAYCGAVCVVFAVLFSIAQTSDNVALRTLSLTLLPALLALGIVISAVLHFKSSELKREINGYIQAILIENAPLMHPEKSELSFSVMTTDTEVLIKVNNYKELIKFDFSVFKKLSLMRKSDVCAAVAERLTTTFCRLYERGAKYESVSYFLADRSKKKSVFIIENGQPDKRAYKQYLKAGN